MRKFLTDQGSAGIDTGISVRMPAATLTQQRVRCSVNEPERCENTANDRTRAGDKKYSAAPFFLDDNFDWRWLNDEDDARQGIAIAPVACYKSNQVCRRVLVGLKGGAVEEAVRRRHKLAMRRSRKGLPRRYR